MYRSIIIILLFVICKASSCKNCVEATYQFNIQGLFSPEKDSIQVGDTLWVISSHPTTFSDGTKDIEFSGANVGTNFRIFKFGESYPDLSGAVNDFLFVKGNGREANDDNNPAENKGFYFDEINSIYILKIGFIAQKKGVYTIGLNDALGISQQGLGCVKAAITILNANSDSHLHFYQSWRPGYAMSDYERTHLYCFKVY